MWDKLPPLGAHTSIAGGLHNALYSGREVGCDVVQIFSKNQMQWNGKLLLNEEIEKFKLAMEETGVKPVTVHNAYLINLGATNPVTYRNSYDAIVDELRRCEALDIPYLVMHPGSHLGVGEAAGLEQITRSIERAYAESGANRTVLLLENTAGQGTNLGYRFEQLAYLIDRSALKDKIAVCRDTCHLFAAGYDLRTANDWQTVKAEFSRVIGLEKLKAFHLNDSKKGLGSRVDRHARIGQGEIGLAGFRAILRDPDLREIPMILEIPGGNQAYREDLEILRKLC